MRKVRICYYVAFIIFLISLESLFFMHLNNLAGGILRSNFSFIVFVLPVIALIPFGLLVIEFINLHKERSAIKNGTIVKAKFLEIAEFKNMLYKAYKIRFSWKNTKGKIIKTWTDSNYNYEQAQRLKKLRDFVVYTYKDKSAYIEINNLDEDGEPKRIRTKNKKNVKK